MSNSAMTPLTMQQVLDFQKQQQMAAALMGNSAPATQPNAGLANAGGDLSGALMNKNLQNQMQWAQQGITPVKLTNSAFNPSVTTQAGNWLSNLFSMGGGS